jgi:extracellular elastinolytic metalloproteinase
MRMYVWTSQEGPKRDGDLDNGIIIHEYAHGISIRLTGGPQNVNCLYMGEGGGMGEGWGDFWATILRMNTTHSRSSNFAMGDYASGKPQGIRKFVYSTNMTTNPSTYNYITKPNYRNVHAKGEVWAVILYEVYWNLVDKYGFSNDWFNPSKKAGNIIALQLTVDGMKLQPCRPSFVDARDAILQADEVNFNGENKCDLWKGFAKRGLGLEAQSGGAESFKVPAECEE